MTARAVTCWWQQAIAAGVALLTLSMVSVSVLPAVAAPVALPVTATAASGQSAGAARLIPVRWSGGGCFRCGAFGFHRAFFRRRSFAGRRFFFNRPFFFHRPFVVRRRFFSSRPFFFRRPFVFGRFGGVRFGFFP